MPVAPNFGVPNVGPVAVPSVREQAPNGPGSLPLTNNFEDGPLGAAVTPANSSGASGYGFDNVNVTGAGNAITFDATHSYGAAAVLIDPTHATGLQSLEWNTQLGSQSATHYGRAYIYTTAGNNPAINMVQYLNGTAQGSLVLLLNTGLPRIVDSTGATMVTAAGALPNNQWVRLEWKIVQSTTAGACELLIFNSPDSPTPTATLTSATTFNTLSSVNRVLFGKPVSNGAQTTPFWLDNIAAGASAYMGPVPVVTPLIPPVVVDQAAYTGARLRDQSRRTLVIAPTVQLAAASAPPATTVTPLNTVTVVSRAAFSPAPSRDRRQSHIVSTSVRTAPVAPLVEPRIVSQTPQAAERRTPDRKSAVTAPGVQLAAATAGVAPPTITPTKPIVQDQAAVWRETRQRRRGEVIQPAMQLAAASSTPPLVTPLPRPVVVLARPVVQRQRRVGHVIACRPLTVPVTLPTRPNVVHTLTPPIRRRGRAQCPGIQRFAASAPPPPPRTLITSPVTGVVTVGDNALPATASSGQVQI